jgi:hypothetical protein
VVSFGNLTSVPDEQVVASVSAGWKQGWRVKSGSAVLTRERLKFLPLRGGVARAPGLLGAVVGDQLQKLGDARSASGLDIPLESITEIRRRGSKGMAVRTTSGDFDLAFCWTELSPPLLDALRGLGREVVEDVPNIFRVEHA